ncbi:hypothetical protein Kfla_2194 [Kribbella flavida DSM 17836]|uniref:Uncharacterized protein n=1 Tax=Kribbella flavida (strain DSM 17836 / JCM 10339 / NBRC 14399) TaxID=479435 RepID=D2PTG0_KRIFD|nr:hypothetical protein [Kribbella flavida]ADB31273.1 hypothetical protein Kfla_2194 [Kribbella flavida DSM 17836]
MTIPANDTSSTSEPDDFQVAATAVTRAIRAINAGQRPGDGAEFITHLLATVAANLGSSQAVIAGRPGSWEAAGVRSLLASTVGEDDDYLMSYRTAPVEVVINPEDAFDDLGVYLVYEASADHIGRELFGSRYEAVEKPGPDGRPVVVGRGQLTVDELERMQAVDDLIWDLYDADLASYRAAVVDTINTEAERLRTDPGSLLPAHVPVTVRLLDPNEPGDNFADQTNGWDSSIESQLFQHARAATPLPGGLLPDWSNFRMHEAVLAAGHWPHLRIPELTHYGVPTNAITED